MNERKESVNSIPRESDIRTQLDCLSNRVGQALELSNTLLGRLNPVLRAALTEAITKEEEDLRVCELSDEIFKERIRVEFLVDILQDILERADL